MFKNTGNYVLAQTGPKAGKELCNLQVLYCTYRYRYDNPADSVEINVNSTRKKYFPFDSLGRKKIDDQAAQLLEPSERLYIYYIYR